MRIQSAGLTLVLAMAVGAIDGTANGQTQVMVVQIQDLHLTDEQEAKIADIRKEFRPKVQGAAKELAALVREEVEKISAVLNTEQKQKIQALREEREERREECMAHAIASLKELDLTDAEMTKIGEIRKEFRPRMDKVARELEGLLTDAQKKARAEAVTAGKNRREILQALRLADEQKNQVTTVAKNLAPIAREELEKVRDVLSEGVKDKLPELREERKEQVRNRMAHRIATLQDLNLTDDQKTKIAGIREEYRPKVQEAGNKLRASIREEVEKIVAVIKG
jgi:Spy/CpxP family protein refolding chaperone